MRTPPRRFAAGQSKHLISAIQGPVPSLRALLIDGNRRFAPSYGDGLTNHLPMALRALSRLGAREERLTAFAEAYGRRLEPAPRDERPAALAADLRARGREAVLRERLVALAPGLAGSAFHGVIRVAYAVMSDEPDEPDELAHALVYAADSARPLLPFQKGREADASVILERLRAARIEKPAGGALAERLERVAQDPRFTELAQDLAVSRSTLNEISGIGARLYLAADDFASLHVLTGAHAVRVLTPWWGEHRDAAHHALAVAALASFVVAGSPRHAEARGLDRAAWSEIEARAVASDDDHLAKLVLCCRDEEAALDDAIYRIVATKAARRGRT
jgi:hypothetical protein